jgi:hypothetical protein
MTMTIHPMILAELKARILIIVAYFEIWVIDIHHVVQQIVFHLAVITTATAHADGQHQHDKYP